MEPLTSFVSMAELCRRVKSQRLLKFLTAQLSFSEASGTTVAADKTGNGNIDSFLAELGLLPVEMETP